WRQSAPNPSCPSPFLAPRAPHFLMTLTDRNERVMMSANSEVSVSRRSVVPETTLPVAVASRPIDRSMKRDVASSTRWRDRNRFVEARVVAAQVRSMVTSKEAPAGSSIISTVFVTPADPRHLLLSTLVETIDSDLDAAARDGSTRREGLSPVD